jgi:hypothetical protein
MLNKSPSWRQRLSYPLDPSVVADPVRRVDAESWEQEDRLDRVIAFGLSDASQRISRRGMLSKAGKLLLAVIGASAVSELLPATRGTANAIADCGGGMGSCSWWKECGMCGTKCDCCNGPLGQDACPTCASIGTYWTACCKNWATGGGTCAIVQYWDCLKGSCDAAKIAECQGCDYCNNGCPEPYWTNGGNYLCTKSVATGSTGCSPCHSTA